MKRLLCALAITASLALGGQATADELPSGGDLVAQIDSAPEVAPDDAVGEDVAPPVPALDADGSDADASGDAAAGAIAEAATEAEAGEGAPSTTEVLAQLAALKVEYDQMRDAEEGRDWRLALFGLLAVAFMIVAALLKKAKGLEWSGTRWFPVVAAGIGVGVAVLTKLSTGAPLLDAVMVGLGPPFAVFLHQLKRQREKRKAGA